MRRASVVLRQPEFQIFIFCLMFALFNWPFLAVASNSGFKSLLIYLYGLWSLLILFLFFLQKSIRQKKSEGAASRKGGG